MGGLLHDRLLPFDEHLGITVGAVFTDNGRDFCGKPESHPYELPSRASSTARRRCALPAPTASASA
jgi:hypothetical protein